MSEDFWKDRAGTWRSRAVNAEADLDALRARLAEAERLMQEGGGLLNLLNHGTESVEGCPFCDHSRAVGLYLLRASETGCAAHTENNQ